jgi:DNA recombination protein RmuC
MWFFIIFTIKIEDMEYILAGIGLIAGVALGWLYAYSKALSRGKELEKELEVSREKLSMSEAESSESHRKLDKERAIVSELNQKLAVAGEKERALQEKYDSYKKELEQLQDKFKLEFENIASRILKQNTEDFSNYNQKSIKEALGPLKMKIEAFEKTVGETYDKGLKDTIGLQVEIKKLYELNAKISEDAENLTRALKSDSKKQGNWGEMILERILERSGLIKGEEYLVQESYRNEKGDLIRPDVIICLPENKHIIIDSKVSLTAYEAYMNTEDEDQRPKLHKAHIDSVREHIRGLSGKEYQLAEKLDSPDFVLMFMPLESAFSLAVQNQDDLFNFAWEKKIVIVSPTTLLATLMTVGSIWKHEKQTKNAMEIAVQGGRLFDKFVSFLSDLENLGRQIDRVQNTYHDAHKKLSAGAGNIIGKVKILQELGAKTSKEIPQEYLTGDTETEEESK